VTGNARKVATELNILFGEPRLTFDLDASSEALPSTTVSWD